MLKCKKCGCDQCVKNGTKEGSQRYKCKSCGSTFREGSDLREKYSVEKKIKCVKMYLEGCGIRSIERLEGVSNVLIIYWIRKFSDIVRQKIKETEIPSDVRRIQMLEVDELFSYCQKKLTKSTFGLLLIGTEVVLLTSK